MFYVIQRRHGNHQKHYFAFMVVKYISAKNTQNVIFEISQNGETKRKWSPKEDIVLVTSDKELFHTTMEQLEALKKEHLEKIGAAQEKLNQEIEHFNETMQSAFQKIKLSSQSSFPD